MQATIQELNKQRAKIVTWTFRFILANALNKSARRTRHYKEWFAMPMNYARQMEIPITAKYLNARHKERILDISSPKLLALYYSAVGANVVAGDLEEYFVSDMNCYKELLGLSLETSVFDATKKIPFDDNSFDKAYSISVLEHIPYDGDRIALNEITRILKSGGDLVLTLPAYKTYLEEWTTEGLYWQTINNEDSKSFFQRRYNEDRFNRLVRSSPDLRLIDYCLVAEKPIKEPKLGPTGILLHNSYLINSLPIPKKINLLQGKIPRFPFLSYAAERYASLKCHYLTDNWVDPNIRQVACLLRKV